MADLAKLFRLLEEKEFTAEEMALVTKILNNEFDFGYRTAERAHNIPTQRNYGTGYVKP